MLRLGVCGPAAEYEGGFVGFRVSERKEIRVWELLKVREEGRAGKEGGREEGLGRHRRLNSSARNGMSMAYWQRRRVKRVTRLCPLRCARGLTLNGCRTGQSGFL